MRKDFNDLPPHGQNAMLNHLKKADPDHFDWRIDLLVEQMPDSVDGITAIVR